MTVEFYDTVGSLLRDHLIYVSGTASSIFVMLRDMPIHSKQAINLRTLAGALLSMTADLRELYEFHCVGSVDPSLSVDPEVFKSKLGDVLTQLSDGVLTVEESLDAILDDDQIGEPVSQLIQ